MARPTGFEPVTPAFGGQYSIQLSYGRIKLIVSYSLVDKGMRIVLKSADIFQRRLRFLELLRTIGEARSKLGIQYVFQSFRQV